MNYYYYAIISAIILGFHIFSLKYLDIVLKKKDNKYGHYYIILFIALTVILSRFTIFKGMKRVNNPALVHLILNFSVFIVLFLSITILKIKVKIYKFLFGTFICLFGFYIVNTSV